MYTVKKTKNRCLFKGMYLPPTLYIHAASVVYQSKDYSFCAVRSATPMCFQMHCMWPHLLPLHCERWTSMKRAFKWYWLISSANAVITLMLLICIWSGKAFTGSCWNKITRLTFLCHDYFTRKHHLLYILLHVYCVIIIISAGRGPAHSCLQDYQFWYGKECERNTKAFCFDSKNLHSNIYIKKTC